MKMLVSYRKIWIKQDWYSYQVKLELSEDLTIAPAIVLSEEKDTFVTENWTERNMDQ